MADSPGMFGLLDMVVLGGAAGLAVYWFFLRKKQEAPPIKKLTVAPALQRGTSYDPSFVNKMRNSGKSVVVFYGSQTGTAEEFAGRLAKDSNRYGLKAMVADPEECDMEELGKLAELENSLAIFCMATYGEGDPTDNAQEFYDWLQEGSTELEGLNYAVFGLGNKTYEHFNSMGKYVDKRLSELNATRVYDLGLGDDDANIEDDFVSWREKFWTAVCEHFSITSIGEDVSMRQYTVTLHDDIAPEKLFTGEPARLGSFRNQKLPYDAKNPYLAPISINKELHNGGDRSCMHIEFDISDSKIRYEAGDHVAVYPVNDSALVDTIGRLLEVDLDQAFTLTNVDEDASKQHPFPCPTTFRTALLHYLDITSTPRTNVLKELADYASDPQHKEKLLSMAGASAESKAEYNAWVVKPHRTIVHILEDLPSVKPAIDHLVELLPRLQARYYSISSSPKADPSVISITAVLVEWRTLTERLQRGVATAWLAGKQPAADLRPRVPIYVRKSQFRLPFKPSVPVLMVGPGTGLAPFRGFIQDRAALKKDGKPTGDAYLYFGCRHEKEDYIYRDEMEGYLADGVLTRIYTAFSRDGPDKVYVQHLLKQNQQEVWSVLDNGGHVYVCGDARHMAPDVDKALKEACMASGGMTESAAVDFLKKLRTRGRYSCDVWS